MKHIKQIKAWWVLSDWKNIYIVYRGKRKTPDYSLPKWHCEKNESLEETALRETLEETWITGEIIWKIGEINYSYEENNTIIDCEVHYYAMKIIKIWKKTYIDDVDNIIWLPIDDIENYLTFQNDKNIIKKRKEKYLKFYS